MSLRRPLLAATTTDADLQRIRYPKMMSPKIDGIRAANVGGRLLSRTLKPIPNVHVQACFGRQEYHGLDGELVVGNPWDPHLCDTTRSGVMSRSGAPFVKYCVFDKWDHPAGFEDRLIEARKLVNEFANMIIVPHIMVYSYEQVLEIEKEYLEMGYEGAMLREPDGYYKQNRSTLREEILLKVKRFEDAEAIILECIPLQRNLNARVLDERGLSKRSSHRDNKVNDDLLGSLLVRDCKSGVVFNIGSGFSENDRRWIWDHQTDVIGKLVKYKKFAYGEKDKPRHGIYLGMRDPRDM